LRPTCPNTAPAIVAASDDAAIRAAVTRKLNSRYSADYTITSTTTYEARSALADYAREQTPVALVLADHRSGGTALLAEVRRQHAHTKRTLLLPWGETVQHARRSSPQSVPDKRTTSSSNR
jgi:hypothetical protein